MEDWNFQSHPPFHFLFSLALVGKRSLKERLGGGNVSMKVNPRCARKGLSLSPGPAACPQARAFMAPDLFAHGPNGDLQSGPSHGRSTQPSQAHTAKKDAD